MRFSTIARASFVLCGVLVMIAEQSGPGQREGIAQLFVFGSVQRLARHVAVCGRVHFRVEIAQPDIDPEGRQAAAEGTVATAWIESNSRQIKI
jgi:hypothetical protein